MGPAVKMLPCRLRVEEWPLADRTRWLKARDAGKLFSSGKASNWRPATARNAEKGYGQYLGWLRSVGLLEEMAPMEARISENLLARYLEECLAGRSPLTVASAVGRLALMFKACCPLDGLAWLSDLASAMMRAAKPIRPKLPRLVSPRELLGLGSRLMVEGRARHEAGARFGAVVYRNGLMITLLAVRPLRLKELMALQIGRTFRRTDGGWLIDIPPETTKTRRRRTAWCPAGLTEALDHYVDIIRPALPVRQLPDAGWLWLGLDGPLTANAASNTIARLTLRYLGKRVSPHLFRDCMATAIALEAPEQVGITKSVLGHASLTSSQEHYNQALGYSASEALANVIESVVTEEAGEPSPNSQPASSALPSFKVLLGHRANLQWRAPR